jgi:hypothetical protein
MGTFYARPCGIGIAKLIRLFSCSHLLESFMIFAGLESNDAGLLL